MKEYKIVVLIKQVPDTRNVGKDAMKEDGTVNRAALPAIFNPDDLKALEMALEAKDRLVNAKVSVITMGPGRAADIIRESLFRGADEGFLLSDRKFAASDTLATSYAIAMAVKKLGKVDLIFGGRQAIDGDTAQVGPQVAEKLDMPQVTYAEKLLDVDSKGISLMRRLDHGVESVKAPFPVLITVHGAADECRFRNAQLMLLKKKACTATEAVEKGIDSQKLWAAKPFLKITEWSAADIQPDESRLGGAGSPTKVKQIENVVFATKENKKISADEAGIAAMMQELITAHVIG